LLEPRNASQKKFGASAGFCKGIGAISNEPVIRTLSEAKPDRRIIMEADTKKAIDELKKAVADQEKDLNEVAKQLMGFSKSMSATIEKNLAEYVAKTKADSDKAMKELASDQMGYTKSQLAAVEKNLTAYIDKKTAK
jgi:uncharacterized coiled-coil protein SlyX